MPMNSSAKSRSWFSVFSFQFSVFSFQFSVFSRVSQVFSKYRGQSTACDTKRVGNGQTVVTCVALVS